MKANAKGQLDEPADAGMAPSNHLLRRLGLPDVYAKTVARFGPGERIAAILSLLIVASLSYWSWAPLTQSGWFQMHDDYPAVWLLQMDKCFQDWQLPCRWGPDLAQGFGAAIFNYQPPLPYYVGELLHISGFSFLGAGRTLFILGYLIGAGLMFLFAREFWGNLGGIVSATFYVYAPYHAVDVYVRGALAEHWGIAFLPGVLWGIYKVIREGKAHHHLLLSLFVALLLLSHNLMALIFFPVAAAWSFLLLLKTGDSKRVFGLAVSGLWGFGLAAFFTLPVVFERDIARLEVGVLAHFISWEQLFVSRFWGYGNSSPFDFNDAMSFQIGWLHLAIVALPVLLAPLLWRRHRLGFWVLGFSFLSFWAAAFMTNGWSLVVWERSTDLEFMQFSLRSLFFAALAFSVVAGAAFVLTRRLPLGSLLLLGFLVVCVMLWQRYAALDFVQFPWRFLSLMILMSSVIAGAALVTTRRLPLLSLLLLGALVGGVIAVNDEFFRFGRDLSLVILASSLVAGTIFVLTRRQALLSLLLVGALVGGVIGFNDEFFRYGLHRDITDAENFSGGRWELQTRRFQYVGTAWKQSDVRRATTEIQVAGGDATVSNIKEGSASLAFISESTKSATLVVPIIDFPNWTVRANGEVVQHLNDNAMGLITFTLPPGRTEVFLKLENTGIRTAANSISIVAWALFLLAWPALVVGNRWRRLLPGRR